MINPAKRAEFDKENRLLQQQLVESFKRRQSVKLVSYKQARARCFQTDWSAIEINEPSSLGARLLDDFSLDEIRPYIDWSPFFLTWELKGKYPAILDDAKFGEAARKLYDDALELLDEIVSEKLLSARGVYGFWPAASDGDDIIIYTDESRVEERGEGICHSG